MNQLEAHGLGVAIGEKTLLHPTDLVLRSGELTVLIGRNGAGKSTLAKALVGLVPAEGQVLVNGVRLAEKPARDRARTIAYLPQGQAHSWPLDVENVVGLGRYPHGQTQTDETVERVLTDLGLLELRHRAVTTLSGGEQMRVSLARALAVDADFLVADEPLASLDPHHQFAILDRLQAVTQAEGSSPTGILVVIHDLRLATRYADRIWLLHEGRLVADGHPEKVLTSDHVQRVFDVATTDETVERGGSTIKVALPAAISS
ncbi:MAG: ABC transporter ATP-binding protein [Cohaesibacteraceae bacterium]